MALNRYQVTLKGADNEAGTLNPVEVTVWFSALNSTPKWEGEVEEFLGDTIADTNEWRWSYRARLIPFAYLVDGMQGHDHELYLQLLRGPLSKPFKFIKVVSGPEKIDDDGVTLFWAAAEQQDIPVALTGYQQEDPDDGTLAVTLSFERRSGGL